MATVKVDGENRRIRLTARDAFKLARLLRSNVDLQKLVEIAEDAEGEDEVDSKEVGITVFLDLLDNTLQEEEAVADFFGGTIGLSAEEFLDLELDKLVEYFDAFRQLEGLDSFFTMLQQLVAQSS